MSKFANLQTYSPLLYKPAIKHTNKQANKHVNKIIKGVNFEISCGAALVEDYNMIIWFLSTELIT